MAWDGNGNFSRIHNWASDRDAGIKITASRHDAEDDNLTTGIGACLTKNNETKPTADFRPNATRLYSLGSTALRWITAFISASIKFRSATASFDTILAATDATVADKTITLPDATGTVVISNQPQNYAVAAGTDTYTATLSPVPTAYVTGVDYHITFTNANTATAPTLNLNALGAVTIKKEGGAALVAGDIPANHAGILRHNGTDFILLNPKWPSTVPLARISRAEAFSSTTANMGTVEVGDRILVTGQLEYSVTAAGGSVIFAVLKNSGTATIEFANNATGLRQSTTPNASGGFYANASGVCKVTGAGTLILGTGASASGTTGFSVASAQVHGIVLRGN